MYLSGVLQMTTAYYFGAEYANGIAAAMKTFTYPSRAVITGCLFAAVDISSMVISGKPVRRHSV